jgi:hypothetical protein
MENRKGWSAVEPRSNHWTVLILFDRWRNISITLKTPGSQVNECYGLVYKRGCQEHFYPSTGGRGMVRAIQPSRHGKTLVWCRACS